MRKLLALSLITVSSLNLYADYYSDGFYQSEPYSYYSNGYYQSQPYGYYGSPYQGYYESQGYYGQHQMHYPHLRDYYNQSDYGPVEGYQYQQQQTNARQYYQQHQPIQGSQLNSQQRYMQGSQQYNQQQPIQGNQQLQGNPQQRQDFNKTQSNQLLGDSYNDWNSSNSYSGYYNDPMTSYEDTTKSNSSSWGTSSDSSKYNNPNSSWNSYNDSSRYNANPSGSSWGSYNDSSRSNANPSGTYGESTKGSYSSSSTYDSSRSYDSSKNDTSNKYPQDKYATDSDRLLNSKIRDKISGWFSDKYKNITLNTSNGIVTITGYVESQDDLKKLVDEVQKVNGVKSVNNQVQVKK